MLQLRKGLPQLDYDGLRLLVVFRGLLQLLLLYREIRGSTHIQVTTFGYIVSWRTMQFQKKKNISADGGLVTGALVSMQAKAPILSSKVRMFRLPLSARIDDYINHRADPTCKRLMRSTCFALTIEAAEATSGEVAASFPASPSPPNPPPSSATWVSLPTSSFVARSVSVDAVLKMDASFLYADEVWSLAHSVR